MESTEVGPPTNPFTPTAGATPPILVGREASLEVFGDALDDVPGSPGRLTLVSGVPGVGKTSLLSAYAVLARARGWLVIEESATEGLADRVTAALAGGLLTEHGEPAHGVLFTVDDVDTSMASELRSFATDYEHLELEGSNVALAVSGRPMAIMDVLHDDGLALLRRADPVELRAVPADAVHDAFRTVITDRGRTIDDDALDLATAATHGFPAMIQLVGHHAWESTSGENLDLDAVETGVREARAGLGVAVHAPVLADLPDEDRRFLVMMARDDGPSAISVLATRLGEDAHFVGAYRRRLIDARVIEPASRGRVDCAIPYLREYLREHGTGE